MNIVLFEDEFVKRLYPITTGKPAYSITCAGYCLADWLSQMPGRRTGWVRPHLREIQKLDFPEWNTGIDWDLPVTWLVNARVVPSLSNIQRLKAFRENAISKMESRDRRISVLRSGATVAALVLPTSDLQAVDLIENWRTANIERTFLSANGAESNRNIRSTIKSTTCLKERDIANWDPGFIHDAESATTDEPAIELYEYPHDAVAQNLKCFEENIEHRIATGNFKQRGSGLHLGKGVMFDESCIFDTSRGPIVLDENVKLRPFSYFRGPIYIGPNSKVSEHASIKDKVSIAHTCKIGGEVEASVIEAYSNKQHHGFLGHSYLGSWINLGAGTCNSDLKNTYGKVRVQYGDKKIATGMQFLGCVMGDYAKTAINTSIFTGKIIGTASMAYGFITTNVPSFVNYARTFNGIGNLPPHVIVSTQERMFARRDKSQRECDRQLIRDMYGLTCGERPDDLSDDPLLL